MREGWNCLNTPLSTIMTTSWMALTCIPFQLSYSLSEYTGIHFVHALVATTYVGHYLRNTAVFLLCP